MTRMKSNQKKTKMDLLNEKFRNVRRGERIIASLAAAVALIIIIAVIVIVKHGSTEADEDLESGISYIQALENKDVSEVENAVKALKKAEKKAAFENGEIDVWQQFDDTVIMGDSRAVGFYVYEFLEQRRVLAAGGDTIRNITDNIEALKNLNPGNIILCYGLNDISIGYWNTVEEYLAEMDQMIALLHENLPNAVVYVNSIIPAIDPAFSRAPIWRNIPDWKVEIKKHCEENNIPYIDLTDTLAAHPGLYNEDGIHVPREFYQYWAIDIVTEVNENE